MIDIRALLGVSLIGLVASTAAGCGDASRATATPPPAVVKVEPVVERDVPISVEYVGTLVGYINAQIRARVAGHLVSQNYTEGSPVKAGDLLFQVDPRPFQTTADQADAKLNLAESEVIQSKAQVGASQAQVEQAIAKVAQDEAQVKRAEATQRQTELDVNRYTPLAQRGSVSQQELDNAVQSNQANLAAVAAARAAVLNSQASVSQSRAALEKAAADVKTKEANVAAVRAALAEARLNLGYTRVLSPIAGVAGFRGANIGDYVGPSDSTPLTTVSQVDPIYAEFPVGEQRALTVLRRWAADPSERSRIELELILADGTVYPQRGRGAALDRQVDVTSGTVLGRAVFPNPGNLLRPGQYAKVRAVVEVKKSALLIPQRAVQDVQGVHQVAVVRPDDTVDIRKVKVDVRVGSLWTVTEGLKLGERVVVEGGDRVRAGQKVQPAANTPAEPSAAASRPTVARFFINRPIVAMVISILMVILGVVAMVQLPIALYPGIAPPEILLTARYPGADAVTLEQSVATPIEQQMSGVDKMLYMYSLNQSAGSQMQLRVNFDVTTDPSVDQVLTNLRYSQAASQLPPDVVNQGVNVIKSVTSPLGLFVLYSPKGTYDPLFLANYAYVNINDPMTRVPGIGQVQIFGASQYAIRLWINPDTLAKLDITVNEIASALQAQNTVNPAGQLGGDPIPRGQEFTYTVLAQGRLKSLAEFENVVVRAKPDGALVRIKDVARVELGAQNYIRRGRLNGQPAALIAVYQLPGSNAIQTMKGATKLMEEMKARFPADLDYVTSLDTTLAVSAGIREIAKTLVEALLLVVLVVFIFLQGFRATLIPLLAVPVALVGAFMVFPLLGFSINTLSLFGLVLAIGLVVDDAIVVVEAVEQHIERGLSPRDAALKAMDEVSGPVVAIALVMSAVFIPTAFIPGITGRLYQQFAVTIAVSVLISAFNALTLSPALSALLLRPRREMRGPLGWFFRGFNRVFERVMGGYLDGSRFLIRKAAFAILLLLAAAAVSGVLGIRLPGGFVPEEDQGYIYANVQLPMAASLDRTAAVNDKLDAIFKTQAGIKYYTGVAGFSLLSLVTTTYNSFYFITLEDWDARHKHGLTANVIIQQLNQKLAGVAEAQVFAFSPPAIPGIGTSGGVTFILEDRSGKEPAFLAENTDRFLAAARKRPEFARLFTTLLPSVPQFFAEVDRDKVLKQGISLTSVYQALQAFLGGAFVNYFNQYGRVWQVYVQAEGEFRTNADNVGRFYVRNAAGQPVPLSTLVRMREVNGPEFTTRFNEYRAAQINGLLAPGFSTRQGMQALEEVFAQTMSHDMGFDYSGMSFQEQVASQGVPASAVIAFSVLVVFLLMAALYESWTLPFAVLLATPIAMFGALGALWLRRFEFDVFSQIGLLMVIGLAAKNAILIVEFAKVAYEEGMSLVDAALEGVRVRRRALFMTSFAFILGCVPLWTASGAGAVGRQVLGTVVIGGMLTDTLIASLFISVSFYVSERFRRTSPHGAAPPVSAPAAISGGAGDVPPAGGSRP